MNSKPLQGQPIARPLTREEALRPYEDVAEGMETQFTSYMLEQMRKTIPKETEESSAQQYYGSLLDYERAKLMAKSDTGLGLKKVILDQIVPEYLKHKPNTQQVSMAYQQQQGPATAQNSGQSKELTHE